MQARPGSGTSVVGRRPDNHASALPGQLRPGFVNWISSRLIPPPEVRLKTARSWPGVRLEHRNRGACHGMDFVIITLMARPVDTTAVFHKPSLGRSGRSSTVVLAGHPPTAPVVGPQAPATPPAIDWNRRDGNACRMTRSALAQRQPLPYPLRLPSTVKNLLPRKPMRSERGIHM
jgi:hypothetical protein